jgi:ATP-dependent Clp protease ATP-binding subunit ClpB
MAHLAALAAERKITITLTPGARSLLLREGYDPVYGARPLKRAIQRLIQDPLAMQILDAQVLPGDTVVVDARKGADEMTFKRGDAAVKTA